MIVLLQFSILGVYMAVYAGNFESIQKLSFLLVIIGMIGSTIAYENLKEKLKRLEGQINKNDVIIEQQYKINERI